MPALSATLQVASLIEASGIPYIEKLAKVAVAVIELLEVRIPPFPLTILASDYAVSIEESKEQGRCEGALREHHQYRRCYQSPCQYAWGARSCIFQGHLYGDGQVGHRPLMLYFLHS